MTEDASAGGASENFLTRIEESRKKDNCEEKELILARPESYWPWVSVKRELWLLNQSSISCFFYASSHNHISNIH